MVDVFFGHKINSAKKNCPVKTEQSTYKSNL